MELQKISETEIGIPKEVEVKTLDCLLCEQEQATQHIDRLSQALEGATQRKVAIDTLIEQAIKLGVKREVELEERREEEEFIEK